MASALVLSTATKEKEETTRTTQCGYESRKEDSLRYSSRYDRSRGAEERRSTAHFLSSGRKKRGLKHVLRHPCSRRKFNAGRKAGAGSTLWGQRKEKRKRDEKKPVDEKRKKRERRKRKETRRSAPFCCGGRRERKV